MIQLFKKTITNIRLVLLANILLLLLSFIWLWVHSHNNTYWHWLLTLVLLLQCYLYVQLNKIAKSNYISQLHAHNILHSISEGIIILDTNLIIEFFNKNTQKILFENFSVVIKEHESIKNILGNYTFHFLEEIINRLHDVADVLNISHQFIDINKQPLTFKIIAKKISFNEFGSNDVKYYITFTNITEQVQLNKITSIQQNQLNAFLRKSDIGILIVDEDFIIKETNNAVVSLLGYTEQDVYNTHLYNLFFSQPDFNLFAEQLTANGKSRFVFYFKSKAGTLLYLHITSFSIQTAYAENAICLIITEAEDVVSKSVYLEEAGAMAKLGWWYVDFTTQKILWSDVTKQIHGVDKTYEPNLATAIRFYKNDTYRNLVQSFIEKTFTTATPFNFEAEILTQQGVSKWVRSIGKPKVIDGKVVGIFGVFQDIEMQKKTEKQLITRDVEIYALFDQNPEAIVSINTEGIITSANTAMQLLSELSFEQIQGRSFTDFVTPNERDKAITYFAQTIAGKPCQFEIQSSNIDEFRKYHLQVSSMPITINNAVVGAYVMVKNISKEKQLLQEVSMLSKVASFTNSLVLIINNQFNVIWVNNTFLIKTGYQRGQVLHANLFKALYVQNNKEEVKEYIATMINLVTNFNTNFTLTTASNELLYTKLQVITITNNNDDNEHAYHILIAEDITIEEKLIRQLQKSDEIFKGIFDKNTAAIIIWHPANGRIINANKAFLEIYKYKKKEIEKLCYWDILFLEDDTKSDADLLKEKTKQGVNLQRHITADGSKIYMQTSSHIAEINDEQVVITIAADTTKEIELKKEIEQERQDRINEINASVIKAQDKEREFIGQELHDNINQLIVSGKLYLELYKKEAKEQHAYIDKTNSLLDNALTEIRSLSHNLISPFSKISSLSEAISQMALITSKVGGFKLHIELDEIDNCIVNTNQRNTLYRITQEQLSNILRHANATEVELFFKMYNNKKVFIISDNGAGFDTKILTAGVGLKNIAARCKIYNWNYAISSTPNEGCKVEIVF